MRRSAGVGNFAALLGAAAGAELGARLLTPRDAPPPAAPARIEDHFSAAEIARGRRYARPQVAIGFARSAVEAAALVEIVRRRRGSPPGTPAGGGAVAIAGGAVTGATLSVALSLPGLPLAALARRRALKVGLATQSWRGWGEDLVKSTAIGGVIAAAGGAGVTALTRRWPRTWWLPAAAGSVGVGTVFAALAPVVLDPVFNDFTRLPEGETRSDVLELAQAAGVKVGEVYSIDASRRTTAANAYVTGLGPTKRVVLFDTLLGRYSRDEVRIVVAHELGHVRHRDVLRSVTFAAITAPTLALAVQRLSWLLSDERGSAGALPAIALATGIVSAPVGMIANRMSRVIERRADDFSLRLSGAPEAFVSFERAIALQNIADVQPPRLLAALATHPPPGERIGAALAYARASAD